MHNTLADGAGAVLAAAAPAEKVALSRAAAAAWQSGATTEIGHGAPPDRPARPARPLLLPPRDMPRRRAGGSAAGRIALLHALAHIELNAIDLAWDIVARFTGEGLPRAFYDDWVAVAAEEAKHHALVAARLAELGAGYGDLPAHDGLWEAALATAHDVLARLAVVPLVLEARGLDVTPAMIARLGRFGDTASAAVLQVIYDDEIGHVAAGLRWFTRLCAERGSEPVATYQQLVRRHFRGALKPPFNHSGRDAAGLAEHYYAPLSATF
ncbi:MAG TPA: ferritin-like domain-containing protein [Stellaceae bacterium]|nr:ferritin-like domain-containing protein [Stellaceae bacterium]